MIEKTASVLKKTSLADISLIMITRGIQEVHIQMQHSQGYITPTIGDVNLAIVKHKALIRKFYLSLYTKNII